MAYNARIHWKEVRGARSCVAVRPFTVFFSLAPSWYAFSSNFTTTTLRCCRIAAMCSGKLPSCTWRGHRELVGNKRDVMEARLSAFGLR